MRSVKLKSRFFYSFALSFSLFVNFSFASIPEVESAPKVTLKVHAVGQGNCVTLEVRKPNAKKSEFMIVDIGSTSSEKEAKYTEYQIESSSAPQEDEPQTNQASGPATPVTKKNKPSIPESTLKDSDWHEVLDDADIITSLTKSYREQFIRDMRQTLKKTRNTISVKTVVITHPDQDHYGWLMKLFSHPNDIIEFLIFGGLPSHYYPSDQQGFKDWLRLRLKNKTRIFFPAIQYKALNPEKDDPFQEILNLEKERKFAPHTFSHIQGGDFKKLDLAEAFDFDDKIIISLLSVNPLHIPGPKKVARLADDDADDNKDSLVLKIEHGLSSVMLMGDATQATTNRIKQNYEDDEDSLKFLKSTVLLASHHGSAEHGCNTEEWLKLVDPKCVVISHGHQYGHPQAQAYNNFKQLNLIQVSEHQILVGKGIDKTEDYYEGSLHTTFRAIYSTLNSGTLTFELLPTILKFSSDLSETFQISLEEQKIVEEMIDDIEEDVKITENQEKILLSTRKFQERKTLHHFSVRRMILPSLLEIEEDRSVKEKKTSTISSRMKEKRAEKKPLTLPIPTSGKAKESTAKSASTKNKRSKKALEDMADPDQKKPTIVPSQKKEEQEEKLSKVSTSKTESQGRSAITKEKKLEKTEKKKK